MGARPQGEVFVLPSDGVARIPLRDRAGNVRDWVLVDAVDYHWLNEWRWALASSGYAVRSTCVGGVDRQFIMHREIMGLERDDGKIVDA